MRGLRGGDQAGAAVSERQFLRRRALVNHTAAAAGMGDLLSAWIETDDLLKACRQQLRQLAVAAADVDEARVFAAGPLDGVGQYLYPSRPSMRKIEGTS